MNLFEITIFIELLYFLNEIKANNSVKNLNRLINKSI